ncbi:MAG: OmpH family outer membrane protein [Bacteroidales bacterium]|jgi:outer membrane protein|nr:OmpH family outer membrane protein [Bacteroidales bacterium]
MKKILLLIAAAFLFSVGTADAQKYGHVNSGEILEVMPGIDSLQIKLKAFQDDLQTMYESMMTEYQQKKDKFDREVGTMSSAVRQVREKELQDLATRIQEFQANAQDDLEEKQYELAKPFQDAIQNAINKVAKANGYAYIFDTKILLYYGAGDDITPLVKKELGIK